MSTSITIQPDSNAGKDSFIIQNSSNNLGNQPYVNIGHNYTNDCWTYIQFDLSSITGHDYTIDSAVLSLNMFYQEGNQNFNTYLQAVTGTWAEGTITGQNEPTNESTKYADSAKGTNYGWKTFDITALVQRIADGEITNNGFVIKTDYSSSGKYQQFRSCEYSTASDRPKLDITYGS